MEDQPINYHLLDWSYFCHTKTTEELAESLLMTTMELESTRLKAEQDLKSKDDELNNLKSLLTTAINEKKEAQNNYKTLFHQFHTHHRETTVAPPYSAVSSISDDPNLIPNYGFSSSDCEESIVSSPVPENPPGVSPENQDFSFPAGFPVKELPEKGRFLEAVIKAGPLLQNLMVAGPMPLWKHPPPAVDVRRIPAPAVVPPPESYLFNKKRGFSEGFDCSSETKYGRTSIC